MNIILISRDRSQPRRINLTDRRWVMLGSAILSGFILLGVALGFAIGFQWNGAAGELAQLEGALESEVYAQRDELNRLETDARNHMDALALKLGVLEARATRLDALGQRLTELGKLDDGEFNFTNPPAIGGPQESVSFAERIDLENEINELSQKLADRGRQLSVLEEMLQHRDLDERLQPAGRPVRSGWMSSRYGPRTDPFSGTQSMHSGVDFSGAAGSEILAVGDGVVTWSGKRYGYGLMVEIEHGNGYSTRYAHNQENLVELGQKVAGGDSIAKMGSSGRSTSTHVHFEVLHNGRKVDPKSYVAAIR